MEILRLVIQLIKAAVVNIQCDFVALLVTFCHFKMWTCVKFKFLL